MAWPQGWSLNAAIQRANATPLLSTDRRLNVLEDWRENYVIPWRQNADNRFDELEQDHEQHDKRIKTLEEHGIKNVNPLLQKIPGMENRIDALEGKMGKVEKACQENSQGVSDVRKDTSRILKQNGSILEKLSQKGGGLGGGEYTNGSNAYQQGLFTMGHHQQQLGPVMPWVALTPAPAPFYGRRVYSPPCIHISRSPRSSRRYK
jgi:uncharacterized coiled-coil protein SlyX